MESQIQFIVCHVLANLHELDVTVRGPIEARRPDAIEPIRALIEAANEAWQKRYRVVAIRDQGILWAIHPHRVDPNDEEFVVALRWGWNDQHEVLTSGRSINQLVYDLCAMLPKDADGLPLPVEPKPRESSPEFKSAMDKMWEGFEELRKADPELRNGCSLADLRAWRQSGSVIPPLHHRYTEFAEDGVTVCDVCGAYYWSGKDRDDYGTVVCAGQPLTDPHDTSIHIFDPRRSADLREAQRSDRVVRAMEANGATDPEMFIMRLHRKSAVARLRPEERARYDKERLGIDPNPNRKTKNHA